MKTGRAPASIGRFVAATLCFSASVASTEEALKFADSQREPINWTELEGWVRDDHLAAFAAYQASCQALHKLRLSDEDGAVLTAMRAVCRKAIGMNVQDSEIARTFFEENFQPVRIARLGEVDGLLT